MNRAAAAPRSTQVRAGTRSLAALGPTNRDPQAEKKPAAAGAGRAEGRACAATC